MAYLCDGHDRVGNPLHNMWEKVEADVSDPELPFKRSSFALVVDERDGSYEIVAYKMNDQHSGHYSIWTPQPNPFPNDRDRNHDNWVIQVYSSKTRKWRDGPTLEQHVFKELSDVCVFERKVYFLGWEYLKRRTRPLRFPLLAGAPPVDPAILEREHREFKEDFRLIVWAYDLDSNALSEVVPPAQYFGGPGMHSTFNDKKQQDYREFIRLYVARQPRQAPSTNTLQFSLVVAVKDWTATHSSGSFQESLFRLVLNKEDPSLRYWEIEAMVGISELVAGGPRAALVADTWGVPFVAYDGYDLFRAETDQPWATTRVLCYDRDNQKWVDWYGYGLNELDQVAAVGFVACECCDGDLVSGGRFDEARVMPE